MPPRRVLTPASEREATKVVRAPCVDYDSFETFVKRYSAMHTAYTALIEDAVSFRETPPHRPNSAGGQSWPFFSQQDLLQVGLAEFPELRSRGLHCVMRLTYKRGLRFCMLLNEQIVEAVTTACRTYVNTITGLRSLHTKCHLPMDFRMIRSVMVDAMYRVSGQCDTYEGLIGTNLFDACFLRWVSPLSCVYVPIHRLREWQLAFAMAAHPRLGGRQPCARLHDDALRHVCLALMT